MRWSEQCGLADAISELNNAVAGGNCPWNNATRPVRIQIWATPYAWPSARQHVAALPRNFATAAAAIAALQALLEEGQKSPLPACSSVSASMKPQLNGDHLYGAGYATLDAQKMALPELATLGQLLVDSEDFEDFGLHALPNQVQHIRPASWVFGKLKECAARMASGQAEAASEGLIQIAARAIQGAHAGEASLNESQLAGEIVTSLLLNLGGQLESREMASDRLKSFIGLGLKCYNQHCVGQQSAAKSIAKDLLREIGKHSLSIVALALAEVLHQDGAADMLLMALPPEAPPLAAGQEAKLRQLTEAMVKSLSRATASMSANMTDEEAIRHLGQISRCVLSAAAVLTVGRMASDAGDVDATVSLAAAWIKSFFSTCIGVAPEALHAQQRLWDFLEAGKGASLCPHALDEDCHPRQVLQQMGAHAFGAL